MTKKKREYEIRAYDPVKRRRVRVRGIFFTKREAERALKELKAIIKRDKAAGYPTWKNPRLSERKTAIFEGNIKNKR